jgi:hypothetical protein
MQRRRRGATVDEPGEEELQQLPADKGSACGRDRDYQPGVPRWVMAFAAIGIVLVMMVVIMLLTGHGPSQHLHALAQTAVGADPSAARPGVRPAW